MKLHIEQEYEGELEEKKEDLIKALFPNVASVEESIDIPDREMREKAAQQMLDKMDKRYREMLEQMFDEIEQVLIANRGK